MWSDDVKLRFLRTVQKCDPSCAAWACPNEKHYSPVKSTHSDLTTSSSSADSKAGHTLFQGYHAISSLYCREYIHNIGDV